jgi:hypothetical protein
MTFMVNHAGTVSEGSRNPYREHRQEHLLVRPGSNLEEGGSGGSLKAKGRCCHSQFGVPLPSGELSAIYKWCSNFTMHLVFSSC